MKIYSLASKRQLSLVNESRRTINRHIIFPVLFFAFIVGIRYNVGTDYLSYYSLLKDGGLEGVERLEPLFRFVTRTFTNIGGAPIAYFGLWGGLQLLFFLLAFKRHDVVLPLLVFFLFANGLFGSWMNTIRQDLAACIWLFALNFVENKKIIPYCLLCIIASMIHLSAIVLIIFYPIFSLKWSFIPKPKYQVLIIVFAFIVQKLFVSYYDNISPLLEFYASIFSDGETGAYDSYFGAEINTDNAADVVNTGIGVLIKYISYLIIIVFSEKIRAYFKGKWIDIIYFLFLISFVSQIIIPHGAYFLSRPFQFFYPSLTAMLAYASYYFLHSGKRNYRYLGYFIVGCFVVLFISSVLNPDSTYLLYFQRPRL